MKEYKRFTERVDSGFVSELDCRIAYNKLCAIEDKIERGELVENKVITYVNMGRSGSKTLIDKALKYDELKAKIENGTLIKLPCKVGDTVWYIKNYGFGRYQVVDMEVVGFNFSKYEDTIWVVGRYKEQSSHIYLTKAEAEAKLKEMQNER